MLRPQNTQKSLFCLSMLVAAAAVGVALPAQAATLTIGANNVTNPLVDDGIATGAGTFGLAPATGSQSSGTFVTRTTTPVNGQSITYSFTHINFPTSGLADFATDTASKSAFTLENPAGQNGAVATTWGADSGVGSTKGLNAILFDFSASNIPVRQFGINLLDFEGGDQGIVASNTGGVPARVVAYDSSGAIVFNQQFTNPSGVFGKGGVLPVTFSSEATDPAISRLLFAVGDDDLNDTGTTERWAFAGATFNSLRTNSVPTPALLPGLVAVVAGARRRWKAAQ
jgi:hypothetical protein